MLPFRKSTAVHATFPFSGEQFRYQCTLHFKIVTSHKQMWFVCMVRRLYVRVCKLGRELLATHFLVIRTLPHATEVRNTRNITHMLTKRPAPATNELSPRCPMDENFFKKGPKLQHVADVSFAFKALYLQLPTTACLRGRWKGWVLERDHSSHDNSCTPRARCRFASCMHSTSGPKR